MNHNISTYLFAKGCYIFSAVILPCFNKVQTAKMDYPFSRKHFIQICIFVSGIVMLVLQTMGIVATFMSEKTGFSMYRKTNHQMDIPTVVICQTHKFDQFSPYNNDQSKIDDWFFNQFYWLNEGMNITIPPENVNYSITIGNNTLDHPMLNDSLIIVEELMNAWMGLCYSITFRMNFEMANIYGNINMGAMKIQMSQKVENPTVSIVSPEDRYGFVFPDLGHLIPLKFAAELGEGIVVSNVVKTVWNYLSDAEKSIWGSVSSLSENSCKHYKPTGEDTYMKCQLKAQNDCYRNNATILTGCNCVLNNTFKAYFELSPISFSSWDVCKTKSEYSKCINAMSECYFKKDVSKCPIPCEKVVYKGQVQKWNGHWSENDKESLVIMRMGSMDIEFHDEFLVFDWPTFIGTAGGSLGLFIGFSYTGFMGLLLDNFIGN